MLCELYDSSRLGSFQQRTLKCPCDENQTTRLTMEEEKLKKRENDGKLTSDESEIRCFRYSHTTATIFYAIVMAYFPFFNFLLCQIVSSNGSFESIQISSRCCSMKIQFDFLFLVLFRFRRSTEVTLMFLNFPLPNSELRSLIHFIHSEVQNGKILLCCLRCCLLFIYSQHCEKNGQKILDVIAIVAENFHAF